MISLHEEEWRMQAVCRGSDVNKFFPEAGVSKFHIEEVKKMCNVCPVSAECLELGLRTENEDYGIFGGKTVRERRAIKARRNRLART